MADDTREKREYSPSPSPQDNDADVKVDVNPGEEKSKGRPERLASFQDYIRVFKYANHWDFLALGVAVIASAGAGVTLPLMNVVFGRFVGTFSDFANLQNLTQGSFESQLDQLCLYLFGLFLGRFGLGYINKFCFRMIGIRLSAAIRLHYLRCVFSQSVEVLDTLPPGYCTGVITGVSNTLQLGISEKLGTFVEYMATMIAAIVVAFTWNWQLSLVTSSAILFILLVVAVNLPFVLQGHGRMTKAMSKATAVASEAFASIRMIAACGAENRMAKKFDVFSDETMKHAQFISPLISLQFGLIFFGAFGAFGLSFWYGTKAYLDGDLSNVGVITVVLFSIMIIVFSLQRVSDPLLAVGKATVAACEFFTIIDAPLPPKGHLKDPDVSATGDIVFDKVTFAYPSRPHVKILDELDLRIEAGKITAIVGPSGSGKSTIVGLIERWYNLKEHSVIAKAVEKDKTKEKEKKQKKKKKGNNADDEDTEEEDGDVNEEHTGPPIELGGSVTTSGHSLDDIELKWWRSQVGLVQQEPFLFNETIFTNVAHGLVGSQWENEPEETKRKLVEEACQEAFAEEFIEKLPQGYDTRVGDGGAKLSGGQRQRIAIARSIVRKPKILILDEATSAIDVRGERIVQAALDKVAQNRTTITIAHRLSTIKKADRIVVLKNGRVVESGTHEGLIAKEDGIYAGLVNAQALSLGNPADAGDGDVEAEEDVRALTKEKSRAISEIETDENPKVKERNLFRSFGLLFYESRGLWPLMALTIVMTAGAGSAIPIQSWLFAHSIDIYKWAEVDRSKLGSESRFWSLMWTVLAIGVGIAYCTGFFFSTRMASNVRNKYEKQYFEATVYQKTSFFDEEDHSHGTLTSRAAGDPNQLEELMGVNMASVYIAIFNVTGSIAIAFSFGWKLALVSTAVVLPVLLLSSFWRFRYELQFEKMNSEVFAESSKFASESIGAFRTVSAFTLEDSICDRFERLCNGHVVTAYKKARWVSLLFGFADSSTLGCQALIFWYGGHLLAKGEYQIVPFFVCFLAILNAGEAAGQSLSFGPNAAQVTAAANRILNMRDTRLYDADDSTEGIPDAEGGLKVELQNLKFKYPTRDVPVFNGLSLTVERGQFAALVGASGCGKTSIISLLERFYDLEGGRILCNGQDISDINVFKYRKHLSLVAQEATLFKGTIKENICLGVDAETTTDEQLHQVCRDASIHDFIVSLPEGYNTNIGSRGVSLSGGQKQRIAIARALIRNPDLLLLDEATSSLDSESEKLVQAAFERAGKGRTMLVVAHRLATVQNADVIFVLGEGKLLEKGSHAELLKQRGVYWQMCQSQALDR